MKEWIIGMGMSYVIGAVSSAIMVWWAKHKLEIKTTLENADDKLEERMGVTLPKWVHDLNDKIATSSVAAADKFLSDGANVRNLIRALASGKPEKLEEIKNKLTNIDWTGNIMAQIPEEYKAAVNQIKEDMAVKTAAANMQKALPTQYVPKPEVVKSIVKVAAAANKVNEEPKPVTKELLDRLIEESKARQEALRK